MKIVMCWPRGKTVPSFPVPCGYRIVPWLASDAPAHCALMIAAGFPAWTELRTRIAMRRCLVCGWWIVWDEAIKSIVASAMALKPKREHDRTWGELGWVAVAPEHRQRGLGAAVCAAATGRLLAAELRPMLVVEKGNVAAIKTYLKVGYVMGKPT